MKKRNTFFIMLCILLIVAAVLGMKIKKMMDEERIDFGSHYSDASVEDEFKIDNVNLVKGKIIDVKVYELFDDESLILDEFINGEGTALQTIDSIPEDKRYVLFRIRETFEKWEEDQEYVNTYRLSQSKDGYDEIYFSYISNHAPESELLGGHNYNHVKVSEGDENIVEYGAFIPRDWDQFYFMVDMGNDERGIRIPISVQE